MEMILIITTKNEIKSKNQIDRMEYYRTTNLLLSLFVIIFLFNACYIYFNRMDMSWLILDLGILLIPSVFLAMNFARYSEYKLWRKCIKIKFGNEKAEENFYFGPLPGRNTESNLGESLLNYDYFRKINFFEKGFEESFFFNADGLIGEVKKWQDIEHIYLIPVNQILRHDKDDKVWVQFETTDLKAGGFWVREMDIDSILDFLKTRIGDNWNAVFRGKSDTKIRWLHHQDLQKYMEQAKKQK
jgi:hypothetical protein